MHALFCGCKAHASNKYKANCDTCSYSCNNSENTCPCRSSLCAQQPSMHRNCCMFTDTYPICNTATLIHKLHAPCNSCLRYMTRYPVYKPNTANSKMSEQRSHWCNKASLLFNRLLATGCCLLSDCTACQTAADFGQVCRLCPTLWFNSQQVR